MTSLLVLAALVALAAGACGDDDDDETAQTTETTAPQPTGSSTVSIDMSDYAYAVSGPLTAGGTLKIANVGKEFHVMAGGRFKPGKTMQDLTTALSQAGPPGGGGPTTTASGGATTTSSARATTTTTSRSATTTSGAQGGGGGPDDNPLAEILDEGGLPGNFMGPGEAAEVTVPNLQPGTYGFICFLPTEEEGTPHFAKGMVTELEVVAGPTPPPPTADATYRLAPGQAIQGPATLSPGRHTLKFDAAPGSQQLEPGLARLNRGTTAAQLDTALSRLFEGDDPPPRGAASRVPGQIVFGGLDLLDVTSFYLTVDLRASDYVMIAEDTDVDDPPRPVREILNLKVG